MSIWGKIIGGAAGLALGGPIGAILGVLAGHGADKLVEHSGRPGGTKQIAFTTAVIVLGAKMAKADGVVTRDEVEAFKQVFRVPPEDMKGVGRLFDIAKKNAQGYEPYARQMGRLFKEEPAVLEQLLDALFHIAKADDQYHPDERAFLRRVAELLGFDAAAFDRIEAKHTVRPADDPYAILGVTRGASDDEIKTAYRKLIRENHPDRLVAQGLPTEFIDQATQEMAKINAAYDAVEKERGMA